MAIAEIVQHVSTIALSFTEIQYLRYCVREGLLTTPEYCPVAKVGTFATGQCS